MTFGNKLHSHSFNAAGSVVTPALLKGVSGDTHAGDEVEAIFASCHSRDNKALNHFLK